PRHGALYQLLERGFDGLATSYARSLGWALRRRGLVVGLVLLSAAGAVFLFKGLKREFVPPEDRGWFLTFAIAPEGSTLQYTDAYQRRLEAILARTDGIESYFSVVGGFLGNPSQGIVFCLLEDWATRTRSVDQIIGEVQPQ